MAQTSWPKFLQSANGPKCWLTTTQNSGQIGRTNRNETLSRHVLETVEYWTNLLFLSLAEMHPILRSSWNRNDKLLPPYVLSILTTVTEDHSSDSLRGCISAWSLSTSPRWQLCVGKEIVTKNLEPIWDVSYAVDIITATAVSSVTCGHTTPSISRLQNTGQMGHHQILWVPNDKTDMGPISVVGIQLYPNANKYPSTLPLPRTILPLATKEVYISKWKKSEFEFWHYSFDPLEEMNWPPH